MHGCPRAILGVGRLKVFLTLHLEEDSPGDTDKDERQLERLLQTDGGIRQRRHLFCFSSAASSAWQFVPFHLFAPHADVHR